MRKFQRIGMTPNGKLSPREMEWFAEMGRAFKGSRDRSWLRQMWKSAGLGQPVKPIRAKKPAQYPRGAQRVPAERIAYRRAMFRACQIVCRAIKAGKITDLKKVYVACSDCGNARATTYEHRDYAKPLEVDPVCQSCNMKRGAATISSPVPTRNREAA